MKRLGIGTKFTLLNNGATAGQIKLDRILNGHDDSTASLADPLDHGGKRGRLA